MRRSGVVFAGAGVMAGGLMVAAGLASCSPDKPPATATVVVADAGRVLTADPQPSPPRPLSSWRPGRSFEDIGGGRRGAVVGGRRIVLTGETATVIDDKPLSGLDRPRRVPDALGGGYVFAGSSLWWSRTFDGPLVRVVEKVDAVGFGVNRVLVNGATYELSTGKPVPPPVPDAEELFGLPSGVVVARTKAGEVFLSSALGKPFAKVSSGVLAISYDSHGFVLSSKTGQTRLAFDGKVGPYAAEPGLMSSDNLFAFGDLPDLTKPPPREPDVDRMVGPLTAAMDDGHVLVVDAHDLLVFDIGKGELATTQRDAFANHENCFPLRGGKSAFVGCNDPGGMALFRVDAFDRPPILEKTFKDILTNDFGFPATNSVLTAGGHRCDGSAVVGAFCVRRDEKTWNDVAVSDPKKLLASAPFLVSELATSDGVPYGFAWQNGNGALLVMDGAARTVRAIPKEELPAWTSKAMRWQSVTAEAGRIRFLLPGAHPGVLTVHADNRVEATPISGHLAAIGARGLLVSPDGKVSETLDSGKSWREIEPPPGGADPSALACNEGGCTLGPWHRLGWGH